MKNLIETAKLLSVGQTVLEGRGDHSGETIVIDPKILKVDDKAARKGVTVLTLKRKDAGLPLAKGPGHGETEAPPEVIKTKAVNGKAATFKFKQFGAYRGRMVPRYEAENNLTLYLESVDSPKPDFGKLKSGIQKTVKGIENATGLTFAFRKVNKFDGGFVAMYEITGAEAGDPVVNKLASTVSVAFKKAFPQLDTRATSSIGTPKRTGQKIFVDVEFTNL